MAPQPGDDLVFPAEALRRVNTNTYAAETAFRSITIRGENAGIYGSSIRLTAGLTNAVTSGSNLFRINLLVTNTVTVHCGPGVLYMPAGLTGPNTPNMLTTINKAGPGTLALTGGLGFRVFLRLNEGDLILRSQSFSSSSVSLGPGTALVASGQIGPISAELAHVTADGLSARAMFLDRSTLALPWRGSSVMSIGEVLTLIDARLDVAILASPTLGTPMRLISRNSGSTIFGTFVGLPQGGILTTGGLQYGIDYNGVNLTLTNPPVGLIATNLYGGNGDGIVAENECHLLYLSLENKSANSVNSLSAQIVTLSNTRLMQNQSTYPELPPAGTGANLTPFQLSTPFPLFIPFRPVQGLLLVSNSTFQPYQIPFELPFTDQASDAGRCLECLEVADNIFYSAPQLPFLVQFTNADCQNPAPCPTVVTNNNPGHDYRWIYRTYTYTNPAGPACVTVNVEFSGCTSGGSWAMRGPLDFARICPDYLGGAAGSRTNYSFQVGPGEIFTILVYSFAVIDLCNSAFFKLRLSPESLCPVDLSASLPSPDRFELRWPSYASGYLLEATPQLAPPNWSPTPIYPRITNGYFILEQPPIENRFFRLRKPSVP